MPPERREGETVTAFTMRMIRNEHLEMAAMIADEVAARPTSSWGFIGTSVAEEIARRIRELQDE